MRGGVIALLAVSNLCNAQFVAPSLPDQIVDPVTTRNLGVGNSRPDDVVVNCDMLLAHTLKPVLGIVWDEGCKSNNVYAYFRDVSTGLEARVQIDGSRPDIVIADNPSFPGRYRAIIAHYDRSNRVWITMFDLIGIGTPGFAATYFTDYQITAVSYPAPFYDTDPMPHIDMWSNPLCNANINGTPPLPCMHDYIVTWTEVDQFTGTSDVFYRVGDASGSIPVSAPKNLSTGITGGHAGFSEWSDVACYSDVTNINAIEKHAVFTYRTNINAVPSGLAVVDVNITTAAAPVVHNQNVDYALFPRIEAMNLIRQGFDASIWQVVTIAQVSGVGFGAWQAYGIHNLLPTTMTHLTPIPALNGVDTKSPCVAGGVTQFGSSGIGNSQFTLGFYPWATRNLYVRDVNLSSGVPGANYYQVNTTPLAPWPPDYNLADASKSFALSTCSNTSPYLLSAWYDGYDIGGGAGGHIVMKLTPSPTVMQFKLVTGVKNETNDKLNFYPNPTTDNLYLTAQADYSILSLSGIRLITGTAKVGQPIDVSRLSAGMYWIQLADSHPLKFIKQ